ncbi:MAG: hypothetical protein ACXW4T_02835 [Candidatus Limnocylindrales bacterium]
MLADFEFTFNQHDETIRRAESKARRMAELRGGSSPRAQARATNPLVALLRRVTGIPATA